MIEEIDGDADPSVAGIVALSSMLFADETLESTLKRVVELACQTIGECDCASVTFVASGHPYTLVSTESTAEAIDQAQYDWDAGPCLTALRERRIVSIPSMIHGAGFEQFRAVAVRNGIASSFSLPLVVGDAGIGALNLYGRTVGSFEQVEPEAGLLFAAQAGVAVTNMHLYMPRGRPSSISRSHSSRAT